MLKVNRDLTNFRQALKRKRSQEPAKDEAEDDLVDAFRRYDAAQRDQSEPSEGSYILEGQSPALLRRQK